MRLTRLPARWPNDAVVVETLHAMRSIAAAVRFIAPAALGIAASACWNAPTPLAPSLRGSVGLPHDGALTDAAALPQQGDGYERLRSDSIRYGNPRLIRAIEAAAKQVSARLPGGAPLVVADLSAQRGGRIDGHRSHRTGRDADILFYVRTPDGRSVKNTGFFQFGADGLAPAGRDHSYVMIDVARTWLLVEALTADSDALVQWLFVAHWLEALLVEHALASGVDEELLKRAQYMMRQPSDSFSHDDHFHMRIACAPDEAVAGCSGGGHHWSWLPKPPSAPNLSDDELVALLMGGSQDGQP